MRDLLTLDKKCCLPNLIPGDVVRTKKGNIAIIDSAKVTVNGGSINWNEDLPEIIEHGWMPSYSITYLNGKCFEKCAWFEASEFLTVLGFSPLRGYLK